MVTYLQCNPSPSKWKLQTEGKFEQTERETMLSRRFAFWSPPVVLFDVWTVIFPPRYSFSVKALVYSKTDVENGFCYKTLGVYIGGHFQTLSRCIQYSAHVQPVHTYGLCTQFTWICKDCRRLQTQADDEIQYMSQIASQLCGFNVFNIAANQCKCRCGKWFFVLS